MSDPGRLRDQFLRSETEDPSLRRLRRPRQNSVGPAEVRSGAITGTHFAEVRNVIEIPFDDSIDATHPLECFFVMPSGVRKIAQAIVYVERKSFRAYAQGAGAGAGLITGATPSSSGGATGVVTGADGTGATGAGGTGATGADGTAATPNNGSAAATIDVPTTYVSSEAGSAHSHSDPQGGSTGSESSHPHLVAFDHHHTHGHGSHSHSHTHTGPSHTHTGPSHTHTVPDHSHTIGHSHPVTDHTHNLNYGIFEQAAAGTLSLSVANDGVTYGAAVVSGATSINQDITSQLTTTSGSRRIKIDGTGLTRVQVLLYLDLIVGVIPQ